MPQLDILCYQEKPLSTSNWLYLVELLTKGAQRIPQILLLMILVFLYNMSDTFAENTNVM